MSAGQSRPHHTTTHKQEIVIHTHTYKGLTWEYVKSLKVFVSDTLRSVNMHFLDFIL